MRFRTVVLVVAALLGGAWPSARAAEFQLIKDEAAFARFAQKVGLTENEAEEVLRGLIWPQKSSFRALDLCLEDWRSRGIDVVPLIIFLNHEKSMEEAGLAISQVYTHQQVPFWLGSVQDPRTARFLIDETKRRLSEPWRTVHELNIAGMYVINLGRTREDEALDLLLEIQSEAYWQSDAAPRPVPRTEAEQRFEGSNRIECGKAYFQRIAMGSFARSGTDRAIRTLATGEGLNPAFRFTEGYFRDALESSDGIPDVDFWREEGLPEERLVQMQELATWWQDAVDHGIPVKYAKTLKRGLESGRQFARQYDYVDQYLKRNIDIVPFLLHLLDQENLPRMAHEHPRAITEDIILYWLGETHDSRANARLLERAHNYLDNLADAPEGVPFLRDILWPLGASGSEEGLEFLLKLQSDEYWEGEDAPVIALSAEDGKSREETTQEAIEKIQEIAFRALEVSGSEIALAAFHSGDAINPRFHSRLPGAFETCARLHFDIVGMPEWFGRPLSEETLKGLQELYAKYDKVYVPEETRENMKPTSMPHYR